MPTIAQQPGKSPCCDVPPPLSQPYAFASSPIPRSTATELHSHHPPIIATIHPYLEKSLHASGEIAPEQYHRLLPIIHVGRSETTDSHEAEALAAKVLACRTSREIEALLAYERPGMELKKMGGAKMSHPLQPAWHCLRRQ